MKIDDDMRICSFDIQLMYNNIKKLVVTNIINNIIENNLEIINN
jgi:hypothetical protein